MELRHRLLVFSNGPKYSLLQQMLERLGLVYRRRELGRLSSIEYSSIEYDFSDQDPLSPQLLEFAKSNDILLQSALEYSKKELVSAEWLVVEVGQSQYPQPEDNFEYLSATYNVSDYCSRCGQGGVQSHPFRLKKDFVQRQEKFFGLHWVFDEVFVRPEIKRIFEELQVSGVSFMPVVHYKTGKPFDNVYQMKIDSIADPGMVTDGLNTVTCKPENEESHLPVLRGAKIEHRRPFCGRVKYHYPLTKPLQFRSKVFAGLPDFAKSNEYYGSGELQIGSY